VREIKFRAWNIVTKTMIDLKKITPLALDIDTNGLFIPFSDGLIIMQYTGLKDINGKEIFENDVVKWKYYDCGEECEKILCVVWSDDYAGFFFEDRTDYFLDWQEISIGSCEIVGNIYEDSDVHTIDTGYVEGCSQIFNVRET
jgi:uncharacterized phage protein (TIGR01671 family)